MEPENPEDRPESPKKKIRPSSTTNIDFQPSDSRNATDDMGKEVETNGGMNGVAPTRRNRKVEPCSSSERADPDDCKDKEGSIQEEVVSSSENTILSKQRPSSYSVGDADSLTNDVGDPNNHAEVERSALPHNSEAEKKEL